MGVTTPFVAHTGRPSVMGIVHFDMGQASVSGFDRDRDGLVDENRLVTVVGESQIPVLELPVFAPPRFATPV